MRRFAVLLGGTAPAVAAALTAFFAGLGLGAYLIGRLAPRFARPLRVFAALEIGTALSALAVDPVLRALQPLYAAFYDASADRIALAIALKAGIAIVAVLVPATCMGGTLPVLAQLVAVRAQALGVRAGGLYAVNTCGAAIGAIAVPAVLLPRFGAGGALIVVVATSAAIGVAALCMPAGAATAAERAARRLSRRDRKPIATSSRAPIVAAFVSGVVTLALEALAARAFALVHENSAYSFATVVSVFLAGLAGGAAVARSALRRGIRARSLVVIGWAAAGAWIVCLPALFVRVTGLEYLAGGSLVAHEMQLAGLVAACVLVPGVLLGLVLPALMQEAGEGAQDGGPAVGAIVGANTIGAIVGPPLALFAIAPWTGLWPAVTLLGGASLVAAAFAAGSASRAARRTLAGAIATAIAAVLVAPPRALPALKIAPGDRLLDVREGAFGTVAVVERSGHRRIKLNNFYVLGGTASAGDERLQGHIPLLLHAAPHRVAYLGVGTGISLSAVRFHPIEDVVALELVPEVASAARQWFAGANLGVLTDPRVRVRAEDARTFVGATRDRFDVVIGDLVVPWRRGESSLYTQESFESVRRVLAPGGLYCQWLPLYQFSAAEFDSIAATFLDVFPRTTLWVGGFNAGEPAVALVGHAAGALDAGAADGRTRELAAAPDRTNPYLSHPAGLWLYFVGPLDPAAERLRQAPRNRDASAWVELSSPALHLRIERGEARAFVGRALKARLDAIRTAPIAGSVAAPLDAAHLEWRDRGADIWQAALLSFEGDNAAADRLGLATLARLPVEVQVAVTGGPVSRWP